MASLVIVQLLPWGLRLTDGADLNLTAPRVFGAVIVVACYLIAGGTVACVIGDATAARHAIAYGLGWQGLVGGLLKVEPDGNHG